MERIGKEAAKAAIDVLVESAKRLDMEVEDLAYRLRELGGVAGLLGVVSQYELGAVEQGWEGLYLETRRQKFLRTAARPLRYSVRVEVGAGGGFVLERFVPSFWHGVAPATQDLRTINEQARQLLIDLTWEEV